MCQCPIHCYCVVLVVADCIPTIASSGTISFSFTAGFVTPCTRTQLPIGNRPQVVKCIEVLIF